MKTQILRLEIFAGHGMCAVSGFIDFDFDKGSVLNHKLPYDIHREIAETWLRYDIATAQKICQERIEQYNTYNCPMYANAKEVLL